MKTDTPNPLEHLDFKTPSMPLHEERLRLALVTSTPTKQSFFSTMKTLKMLSSAVTICAVIAIAGYTVFNEKYAPHAQARELATQSLQQARLLTPAEVASFNKQFGGTPEQALADAQTAPDLKIISESQFQSVFSNPGSGAISMSMQASAVSASGQEVEAPTTAALGAPDSGQTMVISGSATVASDAAGSESGVGNTGPVMIAPTPGNALELNTNGGMMSEQTGQLSSGTNGPITPVTQSVEHLKYLEYTDVNGNTVVIGLNAENKPIMKAMKSASK